MTTTLSLAALTSWLTQFCQDARAAEGKLNDLDAAAGDGEHGSNLGLGADAVQELLTQNTFADAATLLDAVGMAIVNAVGGASGALYGTFFLRLSDVGHHRSHLDLDAVVTAVSSALDGIMELGRAAAGDRTLIDALAPFVSTLTAARDDGSTLADALTAAATAAEAGRDATRHMAARVGRASYVGTRSVGHPDAGATSMALLLRALANAALATPPQPPAPLPQAAGQQTRPNGPDTSRIASTSTQ